MNIIHLIHVLDIQRISNGYITVAAEEVQRHYLAHHRYTIWVRAFCTRRRHDTRCRPAANHSSADIERQHCDLECDITLYNSYTSKIYC